MIRSTFYWLLMRLKSLSCGRFALQNSIVSILVMHWVGAMEKVLGHSKCKFRFLLKCLYAIRKLSVNFLKNFYYFTVMFFIKISLISSDIYTLFIDWKFICLCNFMVVPENIFFYYFDNESNVISFYANTEHSFHLSRVSLVFHMNSTRWRNWKGCIRKLCHENIFNFILLRSFQPGLRCDATVRCW